MFTAFLIWFFYSAFKDDYKRNHGTTEGYNEKFIKWCLILLILTLLPPQLTAFIILIWLVYQVYLGYKGVDAN